MQFMMMFTYTTPCQSLQKTNYRNTKNYYKIMKIKV